MELPWAVGKTTGRDTRGGEVGGGGEGDHSRHLEALAPFTVVSTDLGTFPMESGESKACDQGVKLPGFLSRWSWRFQSYLIKLVLSSLNILDFGKNSVTC